MIDSFDFVTTPKNQLGFINRQIVAELCDDLADRAWDEYVEPDADDNMLEGISIIDASEFEDRYFNDEEAGDDALADDPWAEHLTPLTVLQKSILERDGYSVIDLGAEYGENWVGRYQWEHSNGSFQDSEPSYSREEAWRDALRQFNYSR
jgi:hypothetical protein